MQKLRSALPVLGAGTQQGWFPALVVMPPVPTPPSGNDENFIGAPIKAMPKPAGMAAPHSGYLPEIYLPSEPAALPPAAFSEVAEEVSESPFIAAPDFNDEELTEAFAPIMEAAVRKAVYSMEKSNIDAFLEPMLRATVRRALAEYSPASRPFEQPGFVDRTVWRMQALFSSRTYDEVLFEKTHRFQIEEVYLLDAETLALVSFASCDPARHGSVKRIEGAAQRIALQLRGVDGVVRQSFEQADGRSIITEKGEFVVLVAVVRGQPNELILADLGFSLHRIEDHFRERFQQAGSALLYALQPFLEDCLLIQAPASAA